jgi:hypothetical protein
MANNKYNRKGKARIKGKVNTNITSKPSNSHKSSYDGMYEDSHNTIITDSWGIAGDLPGEFSDMDFTLVDDE